MENFDSNATDINVQKLTAQEIEDNKIRDMIETVQGEYRHNRSVQKFVC